MASLQHSGVYWVTPLVMLLSLLAAITFAIGHHLYYHSLAGQVSPTGYLHFAGQSISQQQFHLSVGNTFAYLFKMFLSLSVATAYMQAFWHAIQHKRRNATLSELDSIYSVLSNILGLFKVQVWRTYPILLLLGIVSWCLSISSLITPATLSVQSILRQSSAPLQVPQFDFSTLKFVAGMQYSGQLVWNPFSYYTFSGPSQQAQRIAAAVAGIGQILPITPPAPNTSWTSDVWVPTMQCSEVTGEQRDQIWTNIWNSLDSSYGGNCRDRYAYLSWTPCTGYQDAPNAPFSSDAQHPGFCGDRTLNIRNSSQPLVLYVAALPSLAPVGFAQGVEGYCELSWPGNEPQCKGTFCDCVFQNVTDLNQYISNGTSPGNSILRCPGYKPADFFKDASLTSCKFMNTSLSLDFAYPEGLQDIRIRAGSAPSVPINTAVTSVIGPQDTDSVLTNCSKLLGPDVGDVPSPEDTDGAGCIYDPAVPRQMSYQGIISAFSDLVIGFGAYKTDSVFPKLPINVTSTVLADTEELAFLQNNTSTHYVYAPEFTISLQTLLMNSSEQAYNTLAEVPTHGTRGKLRDTLEELFQNFTISLLAEPYLQPNYSSPFAPERLTNVTSTQSVNIYVYAWTTLWLAYGLAILLACVVVAFGATIMITNGASYNNNFSTVFRASRAAETNVEESPEKETAQEPLPKHLAKAEVRFRQSRNADDPGLSQRREEKNDQAVVTSSLLSQSDRASDRTAER